jgi:hypothetical protein
VSGAARQQAVGRAAKSWGSIRITYMGKAPDHSADRIIHRIPPATDWKLGQFILSGDEACVPRDQVIEIGLSGGPDPAGGNRILVPYVETWSWSRLVELIRIGAGGEAPEPPTSALAECALGPDVRARFKLEGQDHGCR